METALLEPQSCTKEIISKKLEDFCDRVEYNYNLEIDSYDDTTESFKIVNHRMQEAFSVSMDDIIKQNVKDVVEALETGIVNKVFQISRIVGYFSRISNWNSSKISELRARAGVGKNVMQSNYWESPRVNSEDTIRALTRM